jgi:hypothetical protein
MSATRGNGMEMRIYFGVAIASIVMCIIFGVQGNWEAFAGCVAACVMAFRVMVSVAEDDKKKDLVSRLEPFAKGCFSGHVNEWPQLKPLMRDVYDYLKQGSQRWGVDVDCSCVYVENDGGSYEFSSVKIVAARKQHKCGECGEIINPGDQYEYHSGKWDGEICVDKTCGICMEIRNKFFCTCWCYGGVMRDFREHVAEMNGDLSESCIAELSPDARERVCSIIERYWSRKKEN